VRAAKGFTIVEVLIATMILGVLIGSILGPLGGLFRMTQRSQELLSNTTLAQQTVEKIVNDWRDIDKFSHSCISSSTVIPSGVTVEIQNLDSSGSVATATAYSIQDCSSAADAVPLKRVKVTASANGTAPSVIVVDIARP